MLSVEVGDEDGHVHQVDEEALAFSFPPLPSDVESESLRRWDFDQWNYKEDQLLTLLHNMFTDFGLQVCPLCLDFLY